MTAGVPPLRKGTASPPLRKTISAEDALIDDYLRRDKKPPPGRSNLFDAYYWLHNSNNFTCGTQPSYYMISTWGRRYSHVIPPPAVMKVGVRAVRTNF
ncbi:hypothetical protein MTP99_013303 [Tenebrio molitor]|nr:hypothetical protein MTP99_013303 [Tenebrio molitor]